MMDDDGEFEAMTQRERFLELVLLGTPPRLAGHEVKWTPRQLKIELSDPEFAEMVDACKEMRDDGIEAVLYELAHRRNLGAIQMILFNRRAADWKDVKRIEVSSEHTINIGDVRSVKQAVQELIREGGVAALQPGGVIDVDSEEM